MHSKTTLTALTSLLLLGTAPAFAQEVDAEAFASRLVAVAGEQGIPLSYESAAAEGANVTLTGMRFFEAAGGEGAGSMGAAAAGGEAVDVTFQGVSGSDAEGWFVESVPIDDIEDVQEDGKRAAISGISLTGITIAGTQPDADASPVLALAPLYFESAGIASATFEEGGKTVFTLENMLIENEIADDGTFSSDFDFGTFDADLTAAPAEEEGAQTIRAVGYDRLGGSISGTVDWNPESGVLSLDPFTIDVNDAGELSFTYAISGYTPQFIEQLQTMQQQMASNPDDQSAAGMAIMGLVSQLYLDSAVLGYTDASLADKLLDYFAEQNGVSREDFVAGLKQSVPQMLAMLNNAEFQTSVTEAVSAFLDDPQDITIAIEPENPIPATQIMGAAMGAPQTLPNVLQVTVTANEGTGAN